MKFTNRAAALCQAQRTGGIWVISPVVVLLWRQQRKFIQKLMVATTAHQRAIHLSDALVRYCDLCKCEQLF